MKLLKEWNISKKSIELYFSEDGNSLIAVRDGSAVASISLIPAGVAVNFSHVKIIVNEQSQTLTII